MAEILIVDDERAIREGLKITVINFNAVPSNARR